ncbi:hypothetical protein ACWCPF_25530 [Streptomyces sp. NPDC001858]
MSITIRLVGGPADGRTLPVSDDEPPWRYLIPLPTSVADLLSTSLEPDPIPAAEYEPILSGGWPSRADDGAYLYQHRVPPVTPEQRQALERSQREAQAAEEARAAETDAAWQEIRRERPHYPEDWRDLF